MTLALVAMGRTVMAQQRNPAGLPAPTGPLTIGTAVFTITDSSRADSLGKGDKHRQFNVQLWYPASAPGGGVHARYLVEPALLHTLLERQYYGVDSATLRSWGELTTHAWWNAAPRRGRYPILTMSHGLGMARANYTSLAEELASYGYVIVAIDHPHSGLAVLPHGVILSTDDLGDAVNDPAAMRRRAADEVGDISFILDRLHARTVPRRAAEVSTAIDWQRAGAFGHSSGGLVAVEACNRNVQLRACVNLDGGLVTPEGQPMADFVAGGVTKPTLILRSQPIYSDEDHARRGRTREQWEASGKPALAALDSLARRSSGALFIGRVAGTGHLSFSDGPFTMPTTITRFGGKIIDATRGWIVITTVVREYFAAVFAGHPATFPGDLLSRFPELMLSGAAARSTDGSMAKP
jgi:dienelactone hydrolase